MGESAGSREALIRPRAVEYLDEVAGHFSYDESGAVLPISCPKTSWRRLPSSLLHSPYSPTEVPG